MSGGTPTGAGYMRQRHSQGYASSGDDLEDDACSVMRTSSPRTPRVWSRIEIVENVLWLASAAFIVYYGDRKSNLIYLFWHDDRIRRLPLYVGTVGVVLNIIIFCYTSMSAWSVRRFDEKWELASISALPFVTLLGVISFCLFCFALWPIWSFLTLPLLFTLFMACMVICPYVIIGIFRQQHDVLRTDYAASELSEKQYWPRSRASKLLTQPWMVSLVRRRLKFYLMLSLAHCARLTLFDSKQSQSYPFRWKKGYTHTLIVFHSVSFSFYVSLIWLIHLMGTSIEFS